MDYDVMSVSTPVSLRLLQAPSRGKNTTTPWKKSWALVMKKNLEVSVLTADLKCRISTIARGTPVFVFTVV